MNIVAGGLPLFGGRTIVGDATLRSPLTGAGAPRFGSANIDGATFPQARHDKANAYPELVQEGARHKFLVLASEVGGRFSEECVDLVRKLLNFKCDSSNATDKKVFRLLYSRRWWGILSMSVQRAVASNLYGGDWAKIIGPEELTLEDLLCSALAPPHESRMR